MSVDIRKVKDMNGLITYLAEKLSWRIDLDDFEDIEDITYDFEAEDIGLKEEAFVKIKSLRQLPPLVDGQRWGIFCVEFDSKKFEVTALRKILSGLIPKRRNSAEHAVWDQKDLLFICFWGSNNERTIGLAHFEDAESGLPQIKMISCCPTVEDFTQIKVFEDRLKNLKWPANYVDHEKWQEDWSNAFTTGYKQTIHDASTLTVQLAVEAQAIKQRILDILEVETSNGYVHLLYEKFKNTLIHDMTEKQFADMYAQTVVYGLFSARCMDDTQESFSASEAVDCIPNTNPFLKSLMKECLGSQNNSKLSFDELEIGNVVDLLLHTKTEAIIKDFNRQTGGGREDPVIHFYEEFLTAYDKDQKVQRGVYYTPQPVVNFIVHAVDYLIKEEFCLEDGLASTETKKIKYLRQSKRRVDGYFYKDIEDTKEVPAIQILDPATGTGTFLRQTILQIYKNFGEKNKGLNTKGLKKAWNEYVPNHLLPRLNGFELMMAPYAVAHMKLAMVLKDTGYEFRHENRLQVYLTNALEKAGNSDGQMTIFDDPLASESIAANATKKNDGLNIIMGNPPYSGESANINAWIQKLLEDYKKEPGGIKKLQEQNFKWLNDDYVRFIRYSQDVLDRTDKGVLAFINPHGFLDNPTFRGMRWKILQSFEKIYILELHGDSRRKETAPDGSKDVNVFDIQQGVCIFIAIRNRHGNHSLCEVFRKDIYGTREYKYDFLNRTTINDIEWEKVKLDEPYYFFEKRNTSNMNEYSEGFPVDSLFVRSGMGVTTAHDEFVVDQSKEALISRFEQFKHAPCDSEVLHNQFGVKPKKGWDITAGWKNLQTVDDVSKLVFPYSYRIFDKQYIFYEDKLVWRTVRNVMQNMILGKNIALCLIKINRDSKNTVFVSDGITDKTIISSKDNTNVFPLYLYDNPLIGKIHNYNDQIVSKIAQSIGLKYVLEKPMVQRGCFSAYDLFCYIYAILNSSTYFEKYKAFLRSELPRIPYPSNKEQFWRLVDLGQKLIDLHLMTIHIDLKDSFSFIGAGDNVVIKAEYKDGAIYINKNQRFINVDEEVWNHYLAAYQPLQKWMKDRKGKQLKSKDILHYRKMILCIRETQILMKELDAVCL